MTGSNQKTALILEQYEKDVAHFCLRLIQAGGENPPGDVSEVSEVVEAFLTDHEVSFKR